MQDWAPVFPQAQAKYIPSFQFHGFYPMSLELGNQLRGSSQSSLPSASTREEGPYHKEGVPDPEAAPAQWTLRDGDVLAVHSNSLRGCLTHRAAADVLWNLGLADGHHRNGSSGGEPVGFIIAPGIVAHFVDVAVDEWHGAEAGQAGASKPWKEKRWAEAGKFC